MQQTTAKPESNLSKEEEFTKIYNEHFNPLVNSACRFTQSPANSEDLVQDAFEKLLRKWDLMTDGHHRISFLYIAVRNSCINYLNHVKVENKHESETRYLRIDSFENDLDIIMEQNMVGSGIIEDILKELRKLAPRTKQVFRLFYIARMKPKEIGEVLRIAPSTVRVQLLIARNAIRFAMSKQPGLKHEDLKLYAPELLECVREKAESLLV